MEVCIVPVTAKLSRKFYDTFGEELANELVDWFNQVDATYRADLRELNELNFSRFDAKLEQRVVELDAKWERRMAALDAKWERRFSELDAKIDLRIGELDAKIDLRIGELDAKWERSFAGLRGEMNAGFAALRADRAEIVKETIRWMFVFWAGTTATLLGTMVALLKL
jgi:hypothetical protein